ncbi:sensor histidine kinase [Psychromicrobium sp. YIM B11713]|uniref:sensor histidine kinase n=1 Tax=Psychromicrobium sp. YIM B11713 TaxID=3145233 RepID=UPI00374FC8BB
MQRIYEWFRTHHFVVDTAVTGLIWLALAFFPSGNLGLTMTFATLLIIPLIWRRIKPVLAGSIIAGTAVVQWAFAVPPMPADLGVILVVYALAAFGPRWASLSGLGLALLGGLMLVSRYYLFLGLEESSFTLASLPYNAILVILVWCLVLFAWTLGDLTRTRRLREQALEDRAQRLEIEQQQERALAASDERAHIAREMHDIVAHSLSVIITQADGGRYAAEQDPKIATETLRTIADTGRNSLREMRRLLGVLRGDEEASTRPLPGLDDFDELILGIRSAGLTVEFRTEGQPRRKLPAGAELTAYRIVQEGLTNVLKHAGPKANSRVTLSWQSRGLHLEIVDDGRGAAADPPGSGGGNGLRGMTERIKLYDGSLEAKPQAGGGFRVSAFIPYTEA